MPMSALSAPEAHVQYCGRAADQASLRSRFEPEVRDGNPARTPSPLLQKDDVEVWLAGRNSSAHIDTLVSRMYRQRGYLSPQRHCSSAPTAMRRVTLEARHEGRVVGTLSVNLDAGNGLCAQELYAEEIAAFQRPGACFCEFTRLALDSDACSKQSLACLFHIGFVFAFRIYHASDLFIEVNPRHAPFYRRKLGFRLAGGQRICGRVNAPAVLLHKDLAICAQDIARFGGFRVPENKTFYAFMLTPDEERVSVRNIERMLGPGG
ncbi:MAG: hypothetical protein EHM59_20595 [Betaproteobacteria bacterium]|nr:MAG: hypothetical protein EHM59_20595 [Betaproteobacteria bacterium]